jgi:Txe/YoeB family toxin of Txe-Axe toxin-antitoxin module
MERLSEFLKESPEDRTRSRGKLKKLRGDQRGYLQFDITDKHRCWYWVDGNDVYIEYIGAHP